MAVVVLRLHPLRRIARAVEHDGVASRQRADGAGFEVFLEQDPARDPFTRVAARRVGIQGAGVAGVRDAVVVVVRIGVVPQAVAVGVGPFGRVVREDVVGVANPVAVGVGLSSRRGMPHLERVASRGVSAETPDRHIVGAGAHRTRDAEVHARAPVVIRRQHRAVPVQQGPVGVGAAAGVQLKRAGAVDVDAEVVHIARGQLRGGVRRHADGRGRTPGVALVVVALTARVNIEAFRLVDPFDLADVLVEPEKEQMVGQFATLQEFDFRFEVVAQILPPCSLRPDPSRRQDVDAADAIDNRRMRRPVHDQSEAVIDMMCQTESLCRQFGMFIGF